MTQKGKATRGADTGRKIPDGVERAGRQGDCADLDPIWIALAPGSTPSEGAAVRFVSDEMTFWSRDGTELLGRPEATLPEGILTCLGQAGTLGHVREIADGRALLTFAR